MTSIDSIVEFCSINSVVEFFSTSSVTEIIRVVWMEIALASFAVLCYCTVSGHLRRPRKAVHKKPEVAVVPVIAKRPAPATKPKAPKASQPATAAVLPEPPAPELSTCQLIAKAIRENKLSEAISLTKDLLGVDASVCVPPNIAPRLLTAAAKASNFEEVMSEMEVLAGKFEDRALEAAALESLRNQDTQSCSKFLAMSSLLSIPKSQLTFETFAKASSTDLAMLRALVEEAEAPLSKVFAKSVLEACMSMKEADLAAEVFEKIAACDAQPLRHIVEKGSSEGSSKAAASNLQGTSVSKGVSKKDPSATIRASGKHGDLLTAIKTFDKQLVQSTLLYNSIIEACVECANLEKALDYFNAAKRGGFDDVVTFNTLIKGYVAVGDEAKAATLLAELKQKGVVATHASYHGLLNARVVAKDSSGAWKLLQQMQAAGVAPNSITCCILLKGTVATPSDLNKVVALIEGMDQEMDEVLLAAFVEACQRTKRLDILSEVMAKSKSQSSDIPLTAATYGSMIKVYGQSHAMDRVWELWTNMERHNVLPTSITLGCMVEALVTNGCHADALVIVRKMKSEDATRDLLNVVHYSTILKGFAKARDNNVVMTLYKEMKACGCMPNTITYNTIINGLAYGGGMDRVPALLEDMKQAVPPVEPDVVTYSTLVKGFCNSGNLDRALQVLDDMQTEGKLKPDEVMYNSLLDGCTREQRPNDALKLLENMKKSGVAPSNYTLSTLAKLFGRCRRLNQAFTLIEDISSEYGIKVNIQVYTCLMQACFQNRQANKAVTLHEKMIHEGLFPDEMTYSALVKGCINGGLIDKAVELTKFAYSGFANAPGVDARCLEELCTAIGHDAGKALMAALPSTAAGSSKGSSKGSFPKGRGKGTPGKGASKADAAVSAAPWKRSC